ncbi:MAG: glycosyltransferase family 2 protein [Candidatus Geothermincolia bacterium]
MSESLGRVSAVIPNWNRREDLREALDGILAQTYPIHEVIVVDNGSDDGTPEMMARFYPDVMFIRSPHNIFLHSLNIGAKTATGDVILQQDNDGILHPEAVEKMMAVFGLDPRIAVVHCKNLYFDNGEVFDPYRWFTPEQHASDAVFDVPSFHGNGALMRRDALEEVNYIDPDIYQWERSTSAKLLDKGYRVVYYPAAEIRHKISREVRDRGGRLYMMMIGGWSYLARFYPAGRALRKAAVYLVFFMLYSVKHRTWRSFGRGIFDTLLGLPASLRKRNVLRPATIALLESWPYETAMIRFGSLDTLKGWKERRRSR